jgi:hypothetical protein
MIEEKIVCGTCWAQVGAVPERLRLYFGAYGQVCEHCRQKVTHPDVRYRRDLDGRIRAAAS